MCGIAGYWNRDGKPVEVHHLQGMNTALAHRGPDDEGIWSKGEMGLTHRRLSILDLSASGHQPILSQDGRYVVTYNGEIYNHKKLRREIEKSCDYDFTSSCDTEVLPIGFSLWGEKLFDKLEGMFAIAIWDRKEKCLTLARDAIGMKPLYFMKFDNSFYFASEIKAFLVLPSLKPALDANSFHQLMTNGYVSPEQSILKNTMQLKSGTYMRIWPDRDETTVYWKPSRAPAIHDMETATKAITETLDTVVNDMMESDVQIGILQSGGIDSSLISYSAKSQDIPLFTAKFKQKTFDESAEADQVAKALGRNHFKVELDEHQSPLETLKFLARAFEGQLSDSSGFAFSNLCMTIKKHVTVALAGEGGDEFFAGYPTYRASKIGKVASGFLPNPIWQFLGEQAMKKAAGHPARISKAEKFARFALGLAQGQKSMHAQWRRYLFAHQQLGLYGSELSDLSDPDGMAGYAYSIEQADGKSLIDKWMVGDQSYYLPADMLAKTDRISMAHSLEIRLPFLDRRMMSLAGKIDTSLMTPFIGQDKMVLRESLKKLNGPDEIIKYAKKGFNVPIAQMLRKELFETCEKLFMQDADVFSPFLKPDGVRKLWKEHKKVEQNHHYVLWTLLVFGIWKIETGIS